MNTYKQGLIDERFVIKHLSNVYSNVRTSSRKENIEKDIDCWVNNTPISIKAQHICLKTGNLGFELEVQDRYTGEFENSWYYTGKATRYIILVGNKLYRIIKSELEDYVNKYGWDSVKGLTSKTKQMQNENGHHHTDVRIGLIKLDKLVGMGIAVKIKY